MGIKNIFLLSLVIAAIPLSAAHAGWSAARGGPERTGTRPGEADLDQPQVSWSIPLGGELAQDAIWMVEGDPNISVIIAAGGTIAAKAWDDVVIWERETVRANRIVAMIDVDQDGVDDTIVAHRPGVAGTLTLLGMDGSIRWQAPSELGAIVSGIRVTDIDGDNNVDLVIVPFGGSAGITAFSLSATDAPTVLWNTKWDGRDYPGGFFDIIGEFDGTPGLELLSAGHRFFYLYDAATGTLEQTSPRMETVPYSRATLRAVDVDNDGVQEFFAFSNQAWAASQNRRYAASYSWKDGNFSERWTVQLPDSQSDRLAFNDNSIVDLDQDGIQEVVFSIYDSATAQWSLEVRDALTSALLSNLPGLQFSTIVKLDGQRYIATQNDTLLELYKFTRGQPLEQVYQLDGFEIGECRDQHQQYSEAQTKSACTLYNGNLLLVGRDGNENISSLKVLSSLSTPPEFTYVPNADDGIVGYWIPPGAGTVTVVVALSQGKLQPLNDQLLIPSPIITVPYSWNGILFGSAIQSNFAKFPLSLSTSNGAEDVLVIRAGREAVLFSPSQGNATVTGGVSEVWSHSETDRVSLAVGKSETDVLLFDRNIGVTAVSGIDGQELWRRPNILAQKDGLFMHYSPIQVGNETWFHRILSQVYSIVSLSNITGEVVFERELDKNNSGWRRLTIVENGNGQKAVSAGKLREIWTYDGVGAPTSHHQGNVAIMTLGVTNGWLQLSSSLLEVVDFSGQIEWSLAFENPGTRLGTILATEGGQHYTTISGDSNELVSIDTATGITRWTILLSNGVEAAQKTKGKVVFGNATGIETLSESMGATIFVGGSDGFLYAVNATTGALIWSLDVHAPVGEITTSDWDGDGFLELAIVTEDGQVHGIDSFTVPPPTNCIDLDPSQLDNLVDVDRVISIDTLAAAWNPTDNASSYSVAVFTAGGDLVREFADVGNVSQTVITGLPLQSGSRYVVAVRALYADGEVSTDTASNGVTVVFDAVVEPEPELPAPPAQPTGCGCQSQSGTNNLGFILLGILLLGWRRRSSVQ